MGNFTFFVVCPIGLKLEKVCKVSVEGDSLRVHVPVFWTRPSTKGVYKVIENLNLSPEKNQHQSDNIFGRYVDIESHNTRSSHESRRGHISPSEFGLYNEHKEINFDFTVEMDLIKLTLSQTSKKV